MNEETRTTTLYRCDSCGYSTNDRGVAEAHAVGLGHTVSQLQVRHSVDVTETIGATAATRVTHKPPFRVRDLRAGVMLNGVHAPLAVRVYEMDDTELSPDDVLQPGREYRMRFDHA